MAQLVLTRSYHQYLISRPRETCIFSLSLPPPLPCSHPLPRPNISLPISLGTRVEGATNTKPNRFIFRKEQKQRGGETVIDFDRGHSSNLPAYYYILFLKQQRTSHATSIRLPFHDHSFSFESSRCYFDRQ